MPQSYYKNYKKNYGNLQKKKWAPIMRDILPTQVSIPANATDGAYYTLVANANETTIPTSTILKVKHLKVSLDCVFDSTYLSNGFCCIMYVPQGINPSAGMPILHPEWLLAWRNIPNDVTSTHHPIMLNSSLCRNLNSGDSIVCYLSFRNESVGPTNFFYTSRFSGVVRNN